MSARLTAFDGRAYMVERSDGDHPDTITERWEGIGLVGSARTWRGTYWSKGVKWWAAVNPTAEPGHASAYADGFPTRKAAVQWLLDASLGHWRTSTGSSTVKRPLPGSVRGRCSVDQTS